MKKTGTPAQGFWTRESPAGKQPDSLYYKHPPAIKIMKPTKKTGYFAFTVFMAGIPKPLGLFQGL